MAYCVRLLTLFLICNPLWSQTISPNLFANLQWRLLGPFRAGRTVAISGVVGSGAIFYSGGVDGGVWKTDDAGSVWAPIFDDQKVASIGAIEVAPSNPRVIYAATGESDIRSNLASGDGIYKSEDAGKTWRNIGLKDTRQLSRIVIDPHNPDTVFVAALGHAYGPNDERGVFRSSDGGNTWQKVLYKGPQIGAADLALAADTPDIIFASMWETHRPPWSTYAPIAGPGSGLYRSVDGGSTWQQIQGAGFPISHIGRIGIAIARGTQGKRVYASVEAGDNQAGIYRSDDGGNTWSRVNADPRLTGRAWYFSHITADPNDPDVLYVPNVSLYKLSAGGKTLSIVRGAPGGDDYHQLWIDPSNSQRMGLASDQGTTITLNGGVTWSTWYNQPTAQFYHVITDNQFPYRVYGAQQDSSTAGTAFRSDFGQLDARDRFSFGQSESGWVAIDPRDPNIAYASGSYGAIDRFDRRTGQSHNIAPSPVGSFASSVAERKYRASWTPVLLFSPSERGALYFGTQYVMKTLDGGLHWQTISPDLTGALAHSQKVESITVENAKQQGYGTIYSLGLSALSPNLIWAGTDTGLIHLTRDAGKHWQNVTPPDIGAWSKITHLEPSHFNLGEAYAAVDRHRLDDRQPYTYRTRDFGKTWKLIADGISDPAFLNCIREDPKRQGLLYAGTEFGVYVSFDDGDYWQPLQLNLPVTSIRDIVIHDNDLIVATHGRAFWVLDNISPLRELRDSMTTYLFHPATTIRINNDAFSGTPLSPDEPQAKNPAKGAYIDYYLASDAQNVALAILNRQGKVIRRFASTDKPKPVPTNLPIAPRWFEPPPQLSTQVGVHRWMWDLHYGRGAELSADSDDDDSGPAAGPFVLPGTYQVKLTVDGKDFLRSLTIQMDPRSIATPADLNQQFSWGLKVYTSMTEADRALTNAKDKTLRDGLQQSIRALNGLLTAIESADRTPTSQMIAAYQETLDKLKAQLQKVPAAR